MADAKTEKQKVQEITEKLEQGIKELFESEKYKTYLNTMSKFHNYSFNNTMLIAMQKPDATLVAGFKAWQKNFDRHVKKGEKGIRILAPAPYKIKEEQEKLDPVTGEIMLDKNGMPITEEVEIKIPAFRVVPVFDVSQTDGKELPDIGVNELSGSVEDYEDFMQALTEVSPVPITYEDIEGEAKGYFHTTDHRIAIQEGMSQSQTVKTAIHEVAHAKLHDRELNQDIDKVLEKDRNTKEVEAESVAYTVCQHFGIDTSDYSFGYIAGWSSDRDMKELKSSLDTIRKTASELITGIEDRLAELQKDRAVEREQNKESILLIQNDDLTKYSLVSVVGMDRQELMDVLSAMSEDDKLSIQAYLESKGAWTTEIANEDTKEFGEYHLDVRYNTDTEELVDMKERKESYDKSMEPIAAGDVVVKFSGSMGSEWEISKITNMSLDEVKKLLYDMALLNENEWDGDYNAYLKEHGAEMTLISSSAGLNEHAPQFFDFAYDADTGLSASTELSAIQQAENLINRMEHGATVFTDDERNLIVNYNYKLDDMEKTRELVKKLAYMIENQPVNEALTVIDAQAEIDALLDGMIGLSEMHEYGYSWNEMLPLTKDKATELFGEDVAVYQLHEDGSETLIEDLEELKEHEGIFGVEKDDWSAYLEHQSMKQELEESPANREAQLLFGGENRFGIYQLKDTEEARDIHFMGMDYLESKGIAVTKENYNLIYTAPLEEGTSLEDIYTHFNIDRPADFRGHSLSVSDVVVLHQNGENTSHYVDSFGYREVPEFTKELMAEHTKEQASVIDETTEILSEIAQEHANDEPDRENEVFFVNYNEWREVSTLDFEQNYFAIDDPYGDGDFRLLHLQNQIKDITPAGVHYDTYEEAAAALYETEREMANMPFNKENNIGSYMVNGRAQLERIMEARQLQKHMDIENDKVSYYIIADLSTWAENSPERSKLERFDSISEAMEAFQAYRGKDAQYSDDKARTTFGVSVHGIEFDVIHVRNNENVLSLDFTHSSEAKESKHFMDDLQTLSDSIGIDKVRVHRDMTPEEVKDFVKRRFEHQLKQGGLDDISLYMSRFDTLYEQGKMEKLMPTANQKHIEENVPITEWDNPYFEVKEPEQMAFSIKDKFVSIQTCTEGYDYSVFDADYKLVDGGVYDNPDISIHAALKDVLEDFGLSEQDKRNPVDYEELMEKTEAVEREQLSKRIWAEVPEADSVVADFKAKTEELFNGINGQTQDDIEQTVWAYLQSKIDEYEIDVELVDVVVSGSRCRGLEKAGSDLDVVVEYKGREHEDTLFNAFNEDGLMIGGVKVDINPITEGKTGTLATYLPGVESYLAEKQAMQKAPAVEAIPEKTVTLTVAECGEFHSLGEFHENIASVEEAIAVWKSIPPERMNGIPSIGINIHTEGTERYEDVEMDILSGKVIDLEVLDYVPDITDDPKAIEVIEELIDKLPDIEVRGSLEKWQAAILASQIDQLSYDYDTYQYQDTVEDREAQVANITEDIRNGNTGYLNDFLNAVISEGVREGITDIFGEGVEIDDSEAVQTARRAKELLDKLAEYKPLAKVEELSEQNYNMIDNVLNNGAEKKEQEQTKGRVSIKEKLAEKKAVIKQRDKAERTSPEKETDKKHRGRCKKMSKFTVEEINFMCVFETQDRSDMIGQIRQVMPHIKDSDMEELGEQVLGKLQSMTDEEFAEISLEAAE